MRILFLILLVMFSYFNTLKAQNQLNPLSVEGVLNTDTLRVDTILSNTPTNKIVILDTLLLTALEGAQPNDSLVTVDPTTGQLRRRNVATISGINIYSNNGTLSENRTVSMNNNTLNFTGGKVRVDTLLLPKLQSGFAADSIVVVDAVTGQLRRKSPATVAITNIYSNDGVLTGNRTVTMGTNTLNFTGGKIRVDTLLLPKLQSGFAADSIVVVDAVTGQLRRKSPAVAINIYSNDGVLTGNRTVTMSTNNLNFTGGKVGIDTLLLPKLQSGFAADSIVVVDAITGQLRRKSPAVAINIYGNDGVLTGNRTVTMSTNNLNFTGGKVRVDTLLLPKLQSGFAADSIVVVDAITGQLRRKSPATVAITNIYSNDGVLTGNRTVTMSTNNLNFTGGKVRVDTLLLPKLQSGFAADSIVVVDAITGQLRRKSPETVAITNIYSNDGVLTGNRTVTMGTNTLNFKGNIGINKSNPLSPLEFSNSYQDRKIVLFQNTNDDYQFIGFGVTSNTTSWPLSEILKYNINNSTSSHIFYSGINASSSRELMRIKGNGDVFIPNLMGSVTSNAGATTDSIVTVDPATGLLRRRSIASVTTTRRDSSIYTTDGTLTANRTVSMANNNIVFTGGNIGINNPDPFGPLHFGNPNSNRKIILYQAINNEHQFVGFGNDVAGALKYHIASSGGAHVFYAGIDANNSKELMRIWGNGQVVIPDLIGTNRFADASTTDNIVTAEPSSGRLRRIEVSKLNSNNIYNANGTLTTNRTITMSSNSISFTGGGNISTEGKIGIGTDAPQVPLHVQGSSNSTYTYNRSNFFDGRGTSGNLFSSGYSQSSGASIYASGDIVSNSTIRAVENIMFSDKRIKKNITLSDSKLDLNILNKIKVSNYKLIDSLAHGQSTYKKVIAQELEQVFPQAVKTSTNYIPNVYQVSDTIIYLSDTLALISFNKPLDRECIIGRKVRFHDEGGKELSGLIKEVKEKSLVISQVPKNQKGIFVYGVEVNDFKSVDYDAISMLNVSSTQELYKKIAQQETTIQELKNTIQQQEKQLEEILKLLKNKF